MKKLWPIVIIGMMCVPALSAQTDVLEQGSPISINVNTDRNGTIQNAFTAALSGAGFIIDNNNGGYQLNVTITITPLAVPNNPITYVRIDLNADLLDKNGRVVLPYSFSSREGHITQAQAEDRVFSEAMKKINAEYGNLLNGIIAAEPAQSVKQGSTIGIGISGDRSGIIQNAFTTVLSGAGLKIGGNNSDYQLNVTITITPLTVPNVANTEFVRFYLIANLLDSNGKVLLPYTFNRRYGYHNQAGAEERAFSEAQSIINDEYRNLLNVTISK